VTFAEKLTFATRLQLDDLAARFAKLEAALQTESDVPSLDPPDWVWAEVNIALPDNAMDTKGGPTAIDRYFECALRLRMASFWAHQSAADARELLSKCSARAEAGK
jgi:hypothetical protein